MRYGDTYQSLVKEAARYGLKPSLRRLAKMAKKGVVLNRTQLEYAAVSIMKRMSWGGKRECWPWIGQVVRYGRVRTPGFCSASHRIIFGLFVRVPPTDKKVCHSCDNKPCCNPNHLWIGTQLQNVRDCIQKGRQVVTRGSQRPNSVLNEDIVRTARQLKASGLRLKDISRLLGFKQPVLSLAINRRNWKHVI